MSNRSSSLRAIDIVLSGMFVALMAIGSNIGAFIVIAGVVPVTLQTFFATMAGILLGSRLGALSMIAYVLIGLAGVPVFAQFSGGMGSLLSPTFGFVLSFIVLAFVAGKMVEKSTQPGFKTFLSAAMIGLFLNYIIGTNYLYFALQFWAEGEALPYGAAWLMMAPTFPKDFVLAILVAVVAPKIYSVVQKTQPHSVHKQTA